MSFNREQFQDLIERVLSDISMFSPAAVNLLLGTSAQESGFGTYIRQIGGGPALGVFQMEPDTEFDIWDNYLKFRPYPKAKIFAATGVNGPDPESLESNLAYQIAMARVHYRRVPAALPEAEDVYAMALYWKAYYNTAKGKGTAEEFIHNYHRYVLAGGPS